MKRIQRKRTKGWRQPPNTRYCGRGTIHGNDNRIGEINHNTGKPMTREETVQFFRTDIEKHIRIMGEDAFIKKYLLPLMKYENLSCFCPIDKPCHVDVWIEYLDRAEFTPTLIVDAMTGKATLTDV